jgi:hypothetical protein
MAKREAEPIKWLNTNTFIMFWTCLCAASGLIQTILKYRGEFMNKVTGQGWRFRLLPAAKTLSRHLSLSL